MSSHREAPEISQDPVADNTDTYAFVSPDKPDTVTILTNYIPLEAAAGGPNFYEFGIDVAYYIYISNRGTGEADITYEFRFQTEVIDKHSFLYNFGPISSLKDPNFNRRQTYTVSKKVGKGKFKVLAEKLASPPCNIGPHSTPNYPALAEKGIHKLENGEKVFAGQRNDGFFADLGAVFDLADLRPFQTLHIAPMAAAPGIDVLQSNNINVHSIALQIPIKHLTRDHSHPTNPKSKKAVIGVWAGASRRKMRLRGDQNKKHAESGPWVQVSRLGSPLFNELLVTMTRKDGWNRSQPHGDREYSSGVKHPELSRLLPKLYPNEFPNLKALAKSRKVRKDMLAIFLRGVPEGHISGFQNYTGKRLADMLRLNVAIPPTENNPNALGAFAGDLAGYPNGRRVADDIVTIIVRALAAAYYSVFEDGYTTDLAAGIVTQGVATPSTGAPGSGARFLNVFPYLGEPYDGFDRPSQAQASAGESAVPGTPVPLPNLPKASR